MNHGQRQKAAFDTGMYRVQEAELRNNQEQVEHAGAVGTEEVLPLVPVPHRTPRDPLVDYETEQRGPTGPL